MSAGWEGLLSLPTISVLNIFPDNLRHVPAGGQAVAAEEGRAVSEVVSERFGSLVALTGTLTDRRAAHGAYLTYNFPEDLPFCVARRCPYALYAAQPTTAVPLLWSETWCL